VRAVDYNGNTLTKVTGGNTTTYGWDYENRLTNVTLPSGGGTVTFKYDPFGRRIYKSSSSSTSVYAYDGPNVVEEYPSGEYRSRPELADGGRPAI
jgi:YD repeat-containing protein